MELKADNKLFSSAKNSFLKVYLTLVSLCKEI